MAAAKQGKGIHFWETYSPVVKWFSIRFFLLLSRAVSFDCYVDADFCGLWNRRTAHLDPVTAKSRTGFVIRFADCPLTWGSKLQTETALSTTEAEYIALSTALREAIPLMNLMCKVRLCKLAVLPQKGKVHCVV